jgi:predicted DNA-binding transcriptional regulator AlpA
MAQVSKMTQRIVEGKAKLWSLRKVALKLKVSASTLEEWIATGEFPKPDCATGNLRKWSSDTVQFWVRDRWLKSIGFDERPKGTPIPLDEVKSQPLHPFILTDALLKVHPVVW